MLIHNPCYKENEWSGANAWVKEPKVQTTEILLDLQTVSLPVICTYNLIERLLPQSCWEAQMRSEPGIAL